MESIIPISDLQSQAKKIVDGVKTTKDPVIITQRGRPSVMILDYEDYKSIIHTLDEMSYPDWQEKLEEAKVDSVKGRGISLKTLQKKIAKRRNIRARKS